MADERAEIRSVPKPRPREDAAPDTAPALDREALDYLTGLVADFGSSLDLDQILTNVAAGIRRHVDYDTFAVLLLDDLGRQLRFRFTLGYDEEVTRNWSFGLGQGIVGTVAQTREPVCVDDVRREARYITAVPELRSELAVPLAVKGRTIGVLDVGSHRRGHYGPDDLRLISFVGEHLARAIENARLYENVRQQARTLSLLHEVSRELTSLLDREALLAKVAKLIKRLIDYQLLSVMLWNEETQLLEHTFSLRFDERLVNKGGFPLGHGVTGTAAALRQPLRVPNVHLSPHYVACGHGVEVHSELAVPLVFENRLIGVLDLESTRYDAFTAQHEQMMATLSSYVAVALENAALYDKVSAGERRLEADLATARELQKGLLPAAAPAVDGLDIGFAYQTARHLGGDFYDFLPYGEGRWAFAAGDAAGKGSAAALHASLAVGLLRAHVVEHPCAPASMLEELNRHLRQPGIENRFVAMAFGVYDASSRALILANGGFPRPLHVRDGEVRELALEGVPLGLLPDVSYRQQTLPLASGDLVVLTSDGVNEATNRLHEEFGARRLRSLLSDVVGRSAQEIADTLLRSTDEHDVGAAPADDRTILVLKVQ